MSISGIGAAAAYTYFPSRSASGTQPSAASAPSPSGAATGGNAAEQAFLNYMKETPAQQMEDAWLKAHNLTRQQLAAMSPQQRDAIEKQMAADLKQQIQQKVQSNTAAKTGILV